MKIEDKPLNELVSAFFEELRRCQYPVSNISCLSAKISEIEAFALTQGIENYNIETGQKFLSMFYPMTGRFSSWKDIDAQTRNAYWAVGLLNDLFLHGYFTMTKKARILPLPEKDEVLLLNFQKFQLEKGFAEISAKRTTGSIRSFLTYLNSHKVKIAEISEDDIIGYLSAYIDKSKPYINTIILALKRFSDFLVCNEIARNEIAAYIPPLNKMVSPRVPSVWSDTEIKKMLESIDRGNPMGKRDYAILIMAIKLGLRCSDIKNLQFHDIDWDRKCINITQRKTQKPLSIPFSDDVGWAVIDYLKNGRPQTELPYLFVTHTAPIKPFSATTSLYGMISRYRTIAGIDLHENSRRGMHSLRHTFATNLLRNEIPLETIAEMLGHVGMSSVDVYLSVETEELRSIALDPEEVFHHG